MDSDTLAETLEPGTTVHLIWDFSSENPDELDGQSGDVLVVVSQPEPEWVLCKNVRDEEGLVPVSYLSADDINAFDDDDEVEEEEQQQYEIEYDENLEELKPPVEELEDISDYVVGPDLRPIKVDTSDPPPPYEFPSEDPTSSEPSEPFPAAPTLNDASGGTARPDLAVEVSPVQDQTTNHDTVDDDSSELECAEPSTEDPIPTNTEQSAAPVTTPSSSEPADNEPSNEPSNIDSNSAEPSNVEPSVAPVSEPASIPVDVPANEPVDVPANQPVDAPANDQVPPELDLPSFDELSKQLSALREKVTNDDAEKRLSLLLAEEKQTTEEHGHPPPTPKEANEEVDAVVEHLRRTSVSSAKTPAPPPPAPPSAQQAAATFSLNKTLELQNGASGRDPPPPSPSAAARMARNSVSRRTSAPPPPGPAPPPPSHAAPQHKGVPGVLPLSPVRVSPSRRTSKRPTETDILKAQQESKERAKKLAEQNAQEDARRLILEEQRKLEKEKMKKFSQTGRRQIGQQEEKKKAEALKLAHAKHAKSAAVEHVKRAIQADNRKQYVDAYKEYGHALDNFAEALEYRVMKGSEVILERMDGYLERLCMLEPVVCDPSVAGPTNVVDRFPNKLHVLDIMVQLGFQPLKRGLEWKKKAEKHDNDQQQHKALQAYTNSLDYLMSYYKYHLRVDGTVDGAIKQSITVMLDRAEALKQQVPTYL